MKFLSFVSSYTFVTAQQSDSEASKTLQQSSGEFKFTTIRENVTLLHFINTL